MAIHTRVMTSQFLWGIPTFLKLPWLRNREELNKVKPDVAIIGEPFDFGTNHSVQVPGMVQGLFVLPQPCHLHHMSTLTSKQVWIHLEYLKQQIMVM